MEENKEIKDLLEDISSKMDEIIMWLKCGLQEDLCEALAAVFESNEQKIAFEFSDGRTAKEIGEIIGKTGRAVQYWWEDWERKGFVTGRTNKKKCFSLKDFGIEVPPLRKLEKEERGKEKEKVRR